MSTTNDNTDTQETRDRKRLDCLRLEKQVLADGDHRDSLRRLIQRLVCVGRNVNQSDGFDMTPDRALMRFAAFTSKAVAIALAHRPMCEDDHDVELDHDEASMVLIGLSEILSVTPKLIDDLNNAGICITSEGRSE